MLRAVALSRSVSRVALAVGLMSLGAQAAPSSSAPSRTRELIAQVESKPGGKELAKAELTQAKEALVRAERARKAGDHAHAALLEGIALEWAEAASELERAAVAEKAALELEQKLAEVEKKTVRAQALLEQTAARKARASTQLAELESAAGVSKEALDAASPPQKAASPRAQPETKPKAAPAEPAPAQPAQQSAPEKKP